MILAHETSWTLIRDAARGAPEARREFARRYLPVVRAYLAARWSGTARSGEVDDAVQDVFLDCFRANGLLERADPAGGAGFRRFLQGAARTAALHVETRRAREHERRGDSSFHPEHVANDGESLSRVFDRAWAQAVMREAADRQVASVREKGDEALQRVELLRLRINERMPIRDIARLWNVDAQQLHKEYARARQEFADSLRAVVSEHERCSSRRLQDECRKLLDLLHLPG